MPRPRTLSDRELTLATLARQGLLDRWRCSAAEAVRRLVALQAQSSPAPYLALHARVDGFARSDLERALRRGTVVKSTLMRGTLHLVHAGAMPALVGASLRQSAARLRGGRNRDRDLGEGLVAELRAFLAEPRTTDEVRARVRELTDAEAPGGPLDVARGLVAHVHELPSGLYGRHGAFSLRAWTGELLGEPEACARLAASYLAAYGPATREDLAAFCWLPYRQLDPALAALELRHLTDAAGRDLLDAPRAPLPAEGTEAPPRLLPGWDQLLLAHADRTRVLGPEAEDRVFSRVNALVRPSFLLDGRVAGTWAHHRDGDVATLVLTPVAGPPRDDAGLEREAARTLALVAPDATRHEVAWGEAATP